MRASNSRNYILQVTIDTAIVSDEARGHVGFQEWLMKFHGEKIIFPQRESYYPDKKFIQWHAESVFKGSPREL